MDGFMIWRCLVLYRDIPRPRHLTLCVFPFLIAFASIVSGIAFLAAWFSPFKLDVYVPPWRPVIGPLTIFASVSTFINIIFTGLISIRLWLHHSRLLRLVGPGHRSLCRRIIVILPESAALVVVFNVIMIVLLSLSIPAAGLLALSAIHLYVAAPLIILYRIQTRDVAEDISNFNVT
ncbi:hypothetical protein BJ165DRAFT_1134126 [Panaeolus papilionaceus]|nr:hypothetical protein BJ165DRAFT_1134126 [Panaeolus papilionaceus]